jgi:hypothetical protein
MRIIRIPGKSYTDAIRKNIEVLVPPKEKELREDHGRLHYSDRTIYTEPSHTALPTAPPIIDLQGAFDTIIDNSLGSAWAELVIELMGGDERQPYVLATFTPAQDQISWHMNGFDSVLSIHNLTAPVVRDGRVTRIHYVRDGNIIVSVSPETFSLNILNLRIGETINIPELVINFTFS